MVDIVVIPQVNIPWIIFFSLEMQQLRFIHVKKSLMPWQCYSLSRYASSATPAPGRIYTQRQYFEVKKSLMACNNPEKYALSSVFLANRADCPKNYKSAFLEARQITPSPEEKRLLLLTRVYKRESDIPESISEMKIAIMRERLIFMGVLCGMAILITAFVLSIRKAYDVMEMANQKFR